MEQDRLPVLIVDDSPEDQCWLASHIRSAWPFQNLPCLHFAGDVRQALNLARTEHFALALLDWALATGTGGEVLKALRQHGSRMPVVIISQAPCQELGLDLDGMSAAYLNKHQLTTPALHRVIAHALALVSTMGHGRLVKAQEAALGRIRATGLHGRV